MAWSHRRLDAIRVVRSQWESYRWSDEKLRCGASFLGLQQCWQYRMGKNRHAPRFEVAKGIYTEGCGPCGQQFICKSRSTTGYGYCTNSECRRSLRNAVPPPPPHAQGVVNVQRGTSVAAAHTRSRSRRARSRSRRARSEVAASSRARPRSRPRRGEVRSRRGREEKFGRDARLPSPLQTSSIPSSGHGAEEPEAREQGEVKGVKP